MRNILILTIVLLLASCSSDSSQKDEVSKPIVFNSEYDGSVYQVEHALKETLKDPDSYQSMDWSPVFINPAFHEYKCYNPISTKVRMYYDPELKEIDYYKFNKNDKVYADSSNEKAYRIRFGTPENDNLKMWIKKEDVKPAVQDRSWYYGVRHKYRAKNSFAGYVISEQLFFLDSLGTIVNVTEF